MKNTDKIKVALKASNQQLSASEQQLRATNQQLRASEQQLRAANQQLEANNQQLIASEQTIKKEKNFSEKLLQTANVFILILDTNANITLFNTFAEKITGYKKEEVLGKNWFDLFILQSIGSVIPDVFSSVLKEMPEFSSYENLVLCKNGQEKLISWENTVLKNENRELFGVLSIGLDITERKQAEDELKQSETSYRDIFNNATDAIYIQDRECRFLDVNQGAVRMYGYTKEFFIGKTPEFLSAPGKNDLNKIIGFVEDAFNGKPRRYDFWGLRKSGEVFPKIVRSQKGIYLGKEVVITFAHIPR